MSFRAARPVQACPARGARAGDHALNTEAWIRLAATPGLDRALLPTILERCESPSDLERFWRQGPPGLPPLGGLLDPSRQTAARDWLDAPDRHLVHVGHPHYPRLLDELADAPLALYLQGDPELLAYPMLAIVGSRNPSPGGRENALAFGRHLAARGLGICSGLAAGIDSAAHEGALRAGGITVAVLGCGPDRPYPAENAELARSIASDGVLVSEYAPGTPPRRGHFPRRNRLISGLSMGTLVVEAARRSGSLITARLAAEQGREVFAIPGSIHNPMSRGCHQLIRDGAVLVETAEDVLRELGPLARLSTGRSPGPSEGIEAMPDSPPTPPDPQYESLLAALGFEPATVDMLALRTGLTAAEVSSMLLILELQGHVGCAPGGYYTRVNTGT